MTNVTVQVVPALAGARGPQAPQSLETPGGATPFLTTPPERLLTNYTSMYL